MLVYAVYRVGRDRTHARDAGCPSVSPLCDNADPFPLLDAMAELDVNPLLQSWQTPYGLPPFDRVDAEHYLPAFLHAMHAHRAEVNAIAESSDPPTFDNTIAALDKSGSDLQRIERLFFNLTASETSAELQAIERDISPQLAAHRSAIATNAKLFARIDAVHDRRDELPADGEERRLTERIHLDLVREGARLSDAAKTRTRRSWSVLRFSPRDSCRTCWPTRRTTGCRSPTSAIGRACPTMCGRRPAKRRGSAGSTCPGSSRCRVR